MTVAAADQEGGYIEGAWYEKGLAEYVGDCCIRNVTLFVAALAVVPVAASPAQGLDEGTT